MQIACSDATGALKVSSPLDISAAEAFRTALIEHLENHPELTLDLEGATEIDISALQLLCAARTSAAAKGKPFRIAARPENLLETCHRLGLKPEELGL